MTNNALTFDLEEWSHSHVIERFEAKYGRVSREKRVIQNSLRILDMLSCTNSKATFFVVGEIAEEYPDLIKEIERRGHEIGLHGYTHRQVFTMTPTEFSKDLDKGLSVLRPLCSAPIRGYRAPVFSIGAKSKWALDIIKCKGFMYDSSVSGSNMHPQYGASFSMPHPFELGNGLIEMPVSYTSMMGVKIQFGGGGMFRFLPYCLSAAFARLQMSKGWPLLYYFHPWELDWEQKAVGDSDLPFHQKFRLMYGRKLMTRKLNSLLQEHIFSTMYDLYLNWQGSSQFGRR